VGILVVASALGVFGWLEVMKFDLFLASFVLCFVLHLPFSCLLFLLFLVVSVVSVAPNSTGMPACNVRFGITVIQHETISLSCA